MDAEEALTEVVDALNELRIPHMVVGAFSSNYHGIGRSTKDADIVVSIEGRSIRELAERLKSNFQLDPQARFETITGTHKHVFQRRDTPFEVEVFLLSKDEHDQERFSRRQHVEFLGRMSYLPTADDVVIMKLRWSKGRGGGKDRDDVRGVIAVSGDRIDWDYVYSWCDRHGTRELLDEIRRSIPAE